MRLLLILALAVAPAIAQGPVVRLTNATRPARNDFQIGDRFEIVITGAARQPVSVRTTMKGRTNWGPVIGWTDLGGRWATTGQLEKGDFGDWSQVWTVGGKLAKPAIQFYVGAPCLKGGQGFAFLSGPNTVLTCETAEGRQTFATPSDTDSFRTADGRVVPGRISKMSPEQYHAEILQDLITSRGKEMGAVHISLQSSRGGLGDEAADLIMNLIGVNALNEDETRNVLSIVRAVFEKPERIPQSAKDPSRTLLLLRNLADSTDQPSLKQQIAETMAYVQAHP
jgi:hypothetical protein